MKTTATKATEIEALRQAWLAADKVEENARDAAADARLAWSKDPAGKAEIKLLTGRARRATASKKKAWRAYEAARANA